MVTWTTCPGTYLISYKFYIQKVIIVYNGGEAEYNDCKDKISEKYSGY